MANTTFVDKQTIIQASWLNEINNFFYGLFQGAVTADQACHAIGAIRVDGSPEDGQVPTWNEETSKWVPADGGGGGGPKEVLIVSDSEFLLTEEHRNHIIIFQDSDDGVTVGISAGCLELGESITLINYDQYPVVLSLEDLPYAVFTAAKNVTLPYTMPSRGSLVEMTRTMLYEGDGTERYHLSGDLVYKLESPLVIQGSEAQAASIIFADPYGNHISIMQYYNDALAIRGVVNSGGTFSYKPPGISFWANALSGQAVAYGPDADWGIDPERD